MPSETNLYQRAETWWLLVRIDGVRHRESLRTDDVKQARKLRDARVKELKARAKGGGHRDWREVCVAWHAHSVDQLSPSTIKRYLVSLGQCAPYLVQHGVADIDGKVLRKLADGRRASGATAATIRRDLTAVSRVLEFAEAHEWREGNPTLNTRRLLKERRDPIYLPEEDSIAQVMESCSEPLRALVRAAMMTGCRQNELVTAKWSGLDHVAGTLEVIGKGNKRRTIKLSLGAISLLPRRHSDYIWCWPAFNIKTGTTWVPFTQAASDFTHARRTAEERAREEGREFRRFRFHDLRHLHAVEALRDGMGIYALSKHLGHTSVKTTEQSYLAFLTVDQQGDSMR